MKKFIVWFFVVGYCLLPVWLKTPVIGGDLAVFFVLGPPFFAVLYLLFVWLPNSTWEPSGYTRRDLEDDPAAECRRHRETLARSDWRFDSGRMYHSRDHWD